MFGSIKPTASLSSGLLARKGQARPAMRPQGFHGASPILDDLGWNDMGDESSASSSPPTPAPVVSIAPAPAPVAPPAATVPPVLVEREVLREEIEASDAPAPAPAAKPVPRPRAARAAGPAKAKAAFTLRLDADRHLRLRLASASRNRSAQALVVEALDAFLATLPEVETLATQLTADTASRGKQ